MPEKSLTDLPRGVREQFEKGVAALDAALSIADEAAAK